MEAKTTRISLVDDHKMFREGLKFVLSDIENTEVVSESSNGAEFLQEIDEIRPDLVLMDISMPVLNGIETTKEVIRRYPDMKIIALSMFGDEEYYSKMIQAGAKGFIIKESGSEELEKAVREVAAGGTYFSQKLLQNIILSYSGVGSQEPKEEAITLTRRESEVLRLICSGFTNAEIAEKLNLSLRTVEGHRSKLINRTGVKNSIQLVLYVFRHKLFDLGDCTGSEYPCTSL